ncbi:DUF349 domain-containing protein [Isoptericola halotolerans]|uniref:DUF349 domain-containing protein n=1 Tax=Isoptericola halotolerans TaxID=300560 RepID=UPI003890745B
MSESIPGSNGPDDVEGPAEQEQAETPPTDPPAGDTEAAEPSAEAGEPSPETDEQPAPRPPEPEPAAAEQDAAEQAAPEAATDEPAPTPETSKPGTPQPGTPKPRTPKPGAPKPSAIRRARPAASPAAAAPAPVAPVVHDAVEEATASGFGRVDDDGTVYVREAAGERSVGQYPGVSTEEALSLYVRRFLDLAAKVALFETRLDSADLSVREIDQTLSKLSEETAEPAAVGDLDALRTQVDALRGRAAERRRQLEAERAAAKDRAIEARTAIVESAEKIASTDPSKMQWRPAGEELRTLLEQWKDAQRHGPRIDRPTEEALWKRFSHARTAFDRERRHFFAELEQRNTAAKRTKEQLVAEAESLQHSTEWGATAAAYRDLMTQWKAAGRANRKDDDALWARFRSAQDTFFGARDEANAVIDAEYAENLKVKERLLVEAEALLPVTDLASAKSALRDLQDRWEDAGKVPRGDIQRVEGRLRAVESAVREAEDARWKRTNPETQARAEGAAVQLEDAITSLEAELSAAHEAGDRRTVDELEAAIAARRSWLEQVVQAAEDSRG